MNLPWVSRTKYDQRFNGLAEAHIRAEHALRAEHERVQSVARIAVEVLEKALAESRQVASLAEGRFDMERADRLSERDAADRRYADLMTKFTMLRLQGAHEPAPQPVPFAPKEVDPCVAAINAKFSGNRASLRAGAMRQLAADRHAGKDDIDILKAIETGVTDLADIPV